MSRTIVFYRTGSGHCPVEDFLDGLSGKEAQKVAWVLKLIEELEVVPSQYFQKMVSTEDLWEVRVRAGSQTLRLLGFFDGPSRLLLAHGFHKKTQRTPGPAINLAEQRRRDYFRRKLK
jgi:phage-related protein